MPRKRRTPRQNPLKTGVSGARFRKEAAFKNSRRAAAEFGQAIQCSVLIRHAFMSMLSDKKQNEMHKKLTKIVAALIREKRLPAAQRTSLNQLGWSRLDGLHFNDEAGLGTLLQCKHGVDVSPAKGKVIITLSPLIITGKPKSDKSVSHVRIIAGAAAINFDRKTTAHDYCASDYFPRASLPGTPLNLTLTLPAPIIHPLFVVLGLLSFGMGGDKQFYEMPNRRHRALNIIYILPAPPPAPKPKPRSKP